MSTESVVNVNPLRLEGDDGAVTLYATDWDCQRVRNGDFWTHEDTLLLIESFRSNKEKFLDPAKKKIDVWRRIADSFSNRSASACEKKWNNLKHRYKVIKDGQVKSGNRRVTWCYFEKLDTIFRKDPAVEPTFTVSSTVPRKEQKKPAQTETPPPPPKKRKRSLMEEFIDMQKEENEKRRKEMEDFRKRFPGNPKREKRFTERHC